MKQSFKIDLRTIRNAGCPPLLGKIFIFLDASVCSGACHWTWDYHCFLKPVFSRFYCMCCQLYIFFGEESVQVFGPFKKKLSSLFIIKLRKLVIYSLLNMWFDNIFSQLIFFTKVQRQFNGELIGFSINSAGEIGYLYGKKANHDLYFTSYPHTNEMWSKIKLGFQNCGMRDLAHYCSS